MDAASKIDQGRTMAEMWEGFAEAVIPRCPPGHPQYSAMQTTFYAGGLCLFNWFMVQMDEGEEASDADVHRVGAMEEELRAFLESRAGMRGPLQ